METYFICQNRQSLDCYIVDDKRKRHYGDKVIRCFGNLNEANNMLKELTKSRQPLPISYLFNEFPMLRPYRDTMKEYVSIHIFECGKLVTISQPLQYRYWHDFITSYYRPDLKMCSEPIDDCTLGVYFTPDSDDLPF